LKILLISPVADIEDKTPKALRIPQLALHLLKALTPDEHEVKLIEEETVDVNYDEDCDLVGLSCMTSNAPRAYEIAKEFKIRGKKVVFGGIHPSIFPEEALLYGDSVVVGEGEEIWATVVDDFKHNRQQKIYQGGASDFKNFPTVKIESTGPKSFVNVMPVLTTRGCPYSCEFCCVSSIYGKKVRHIEIDRVVENIVANKTKVYLFLDDNIIGNKKYAKELFKALIPLKINWVGQSSISFADDIELMKLARESGCYALFVGLESVMPGEISKLKKAKSEGESAEAIKKMRGEGIAFHASVIFGFDSDTEDTFDYTLNFLLKNKVHSVSFNILTPYPGTPLFDQYKRENRILTYNWKDYNHTQLVYEPKNMTAERFTEKYLLTKKEFYSFSSIMKRSVYNLKHPIVYFGMNMAYRSNSKSDIKAFKLKDSLATV
jgi:radical SAM superfamily enzyme YgiQ (UPF0313 family)